MKRFELEDQEENVKVSDKKHRQITTSEEALEYWSRLNNLEAFRKVLIQRMNPFFAMRVFAGVKSISKLLADDKTPDQKILWKRYFEKVIHLEANQQRLVDYETKRLESKEIFAADPVFLEEYQTILQRHLHQAFGFEKSYRRSFMWIWMLCRIIIREHVNTANIEVKNLSPSSQFLRAFLKNSNMTFIRENNEKVQHPAEHNVQLNNISDFERRPAAFYPDTTKDVRFLPLHVWQLFVTLSASSQYIVYKAAPEMLSVIFLIVEFEVITKITLQNMQNWYINQRVNQEPVLKTIIRRRKQIGKIPSFMFNNGEEDIDRQIAVITTTYPTNPDVGPGIFTGMPLIQCIKCGLDAKYVCDGCKTHVFCSDMCHTEHAKECKIKTK